MLVTTYFPQDRKQLELDGMGTNWAPDNDAFAIKASCHHLGEVKSRVTFATDEADLLGLIAEAENEAGEYHGYITFSKNGECPPARDGEIVLTLYHGCEILCPRSAGGNWEEYDERRGR